MLFGTEVFYFATIRRVTACFGNLFTNIVFSRFSENGNQGTVLKTIRVPLSYGPSEKWLRRINEQVLPQQGLRTKVSVPRMSFELTGMQYDKERKLATMGAINATNITNKNQFLKQLNPAPYDLSFDLNIYIKNHNDGMQIIEQILPNFVPSFNLPINDIPELSVVKDIPVIMAGITKSDSYEGQFTEERIMVWTISFVVKAYIYPNITDAGIIKTVIQNLYAGETVTDPATATITVKVNPIDAGVDDEWTAETEITETDS